MEVTTNLIARFLEIDRAGIVRVEEWEHIFFVRLKSGRPTFVGKKQLNKAFVAKDISLAKRMKDEWDFNPIPPAFGKTVSRDQKELEYKTYASTLDKSVASDVLDAPSISWENCPMVQKIEAKFPGIRDRDIAFILRAAAAA